jgi:hypothetical protein
MIIHWSVVGADRVKKLIAVLVVSLSGLAITAAYAGDRDHDRDHHHHWAAPEIDPSGGITALTLLLGGVAVLRSRIRRK